MTQAAPFAENSANAASPVGAAALSFVRRGWAVFPVFGVAGPQCACQSPTCDRPAKHPIVANGVKAATVDARTVTDWWQRYPSANVGIATGTPSGLWVLDVDGPEGMRTMADLEQKHGRLPATHTAQTGGGGLHLLWALPTGQRLPSRVRVAPGVDVRAEGGYIVAPPSRHASGKPYVWIEGRAPHQTPLVEAPPWLIALAAGQASANAARPDWPTLFRSKLPEGERNHGIAQRAGYLLKLGVHPTVALELLRGWVRTHCTPPLPDREIERTVQSIARRELRRRNAP